MTPTAIVVYIVDTNSFATLSLNIAASLTKHRLERSSLEKTRSWNVSQLANEVSATAIHCDNY